MQQNQLYYYVSFKDLDIYSYHFEGNETDTANRLLGNTFETYADAKIALQKILDNQD